MTRFQATRMIWIDAWLERSPDLGLRRAHLQLAFDISTPQAALDFRRFAEAYPGRLFYDASKKGYFPASGSGRVFEPWQHEAVFAAGRAAKAACEAT